MTLAIETCPFPVKGWAPIEHMVDLFVRLSDGELSEVAAPKWPKLSLTLSSAAKRSKEAGGLVFIARSPSDITAALTSPGFRRPAAFRALWVIDSFWTERFPAAKALKDFDAVGFTQAYDTDFFTSLLGSRAVHLPWGSDVLGFGSENPERSIDLLRVGRQPKDWEDDATNAALAQTHGLTYQGRPPVVGTRSNRQGDLMTKWYAKTKFVLASSNLADATSYTHTSKEYVTARWTDALASGAVIAGYQPLSDIGVIDWPGATLHLERDTQENQMQILNEALKAWTPAQASKNYKTALKRLDWRWRFKTLLDMFDVTPPKLDAELGEIADRM